MERTGRGLRYMALVLPLGSLEGSVSDSRLTIMIELQEQCTVFVVIHDSFYTELAAKIANPKPEFGFARAPVLKQ